MNYFLLPCVLFREALRSTKKLVHLHGSLQGPKGSRGNIRNFIREVCIEVQNHKSSMWNDLAWTSLQL
jgi:hypothetical protein